MKEISPQQLAQLMDAGKNLSIIDVREPFEVQLIQFPKAKNIPLGELAKRLSEIDRHKEHIVVYHSGSRSYYAAQFLEQLGYNVTNMYGGIVEWQKVYRREFL